MTIYRGINHVDDRVPRLSDVRARLAALEHADHQARVETATMTIVNAQPILDLTARLNARERGLRAGASVWVREDIRLADGASRVVPAVFQGYDRRRRHGAITRGRTDDGASRQTWVALEDVVPRHWADDVTDDQPRLAWIAGALPPPPDDRAADLFLIALASLLVIASGVALWGFWG